MDKLIFYNFRIIRRLILEVNGMVAMVALTHLTNMFAPDSNKFTWLTISLHSPLEFKALKG